MSEKCYSLHLIESIDQNYRTYGLYQELSVTKKALEPSLAASTEIELTAACSICLAEGSEVYSALGVGFVRQRAFLLSWRLLGLRF